ncbi:MAG: hypothetical protein FWB89_01945 [Treponema sp.]|nr:hypothetical protein [Treponema sp.]
MKKFFLLILLTGLSTAVFAQNYSAAEQQINQSIQANSAEFNRLAALLKDTTNERELEKLMKSFHARQIEMKFLQDDIEELIRQPATKQAINAQFSRLQDLMKAEQRSLAKLNEIRNR